MSGAFNRIAVPETLELARIRQLPLRDWRLGYGLSNSELVAGLTALFRRPGGTMTLRPAQAAALSELHDCGGLCCPIGVGEGKTLVSALAPRAVNAKRPLLFIPAKLRDKTCREFKSLQREWVFPEPRIESYELLSRVNHATFLDTYEPDFIGCDEAHKLKNPQAAVTRRLMRYLREARRAGRVVYLVILSGTFTRRSIMDYWHLFRAALGDEWCPLPTKWNEAQTWAGALDSKNNEAVGRNPPGALLSLCTLDEYNAIASGKADSLETIRGAFMRRLTGTPGVIATVESSVACSLYLNAEAIDLPGMREHFQNLRDKWETPDGHPFSEAMELWRHARELACGFYYRWNPRPPEEWLQARRAWAKFVREVLSHSRKLDSELQVHNAVIRGDITYGQDILSEWNRLRDTFRPNSEAVWLDGTMLHLAQRWLDKNDGICWVEHTAFGNELSRLTKRPYYGAGGFDASGASIETATGPIIASIAANGEGRNLQRYSANLVVSAPPSGSKWEQLIGRTHRPGQLADEVTFALPFGCREQLSGFEYALRDAAYIQQSTGQPQKLLRFADIDLPEGNAGDPAW